MKDMVNKNLFSSRSSKVTCRKSGAVLASSSHTWRHEIAINSNHQHQQSTLHRPQGNPSRWYVYQFLHCSHLRWRKSSWRGRTLGEDESTTAKRQLDRTTPKRFRRPSLDAKSSMPRVGRVIFKHLQNGARGRD
jgi:hypothetical protein